MNHILTEIASRYELRRKNDRWVGPCPKCGGSAGSDKFNIRDDGGFKCYGCNFRGDIITWLREMDGMSCPEAHEAAGIPCRSTSCQIYGTCRMGDQSGKRTAITGRPLTPRPPAAGNRLPNTVTQNPQGLWSQWASALVNKSAEAIKEQPDLIHWLTNRGIDALAIAHFRLGWLAHDQRVKRKNIGLQPRNGKDHLWVPGGLLIPIMDQDGNIHRIRIRRPAASRDRFLPNLKYVWLQGSGTGPMVIRPADKIRGIVIVEAELDTLAVASAHQQVMVIAIGTVAGGLPDTLRAELSFSRVILVALDAEHGKEGKTGPGPAAIGGWLREYRQARFWPVPSGKDPGEYAQQGGDLQAWIESGLVPEVTAHPPVQDQVLFPDVHQQGEGGGNNQPVGDEEQATSRIITLKDGRSFHVTESRDLWDQLTDAGEIVFSENELLRLQSACGECDPDGAATLAGAVLDVKAVFSGAYVRRGGKARS